MSTTTVGRRFVIVDRDTNVAVGECDAEILELMSLLIKISPRKVRRFIERSLRSRRAVTLQ